MTPKRPFSKSAVGQASRDSIPTTLVAVPKVGFGTSVSLQQGWTFPIKDVKLLKIWWCPGLWIYGFMETGASFCCGGHSLGNDVAMKCLRGRITSLSFLKDPALFTSSPTHVGGCNACNLQLCMKTTAFPSMVCWGKGSRLRPTPGAFRNASHDCRSGRGQQCGWCPGGRFATPPF